MIYNQRRGPLRCSKTRPTVGGWGCRYLPLRGTHARTHTAAEDGKAFVGDRIIVPLKNV